MKKLLALVLVLSIMFIAGAFTSAYATHGEVLAKLEGSKVILGGEARLRGVCKINYDTNDNVDNDNCYWDQRVRLTVTGQIGDAEVRTRIDISDAKWNNATETYGIKVDYAYLHIPVAGVVIDAGRQKATFGNKFYQDDVAKDRFKVSAKVGDATIGAYSDKRSEISPLGTDGFLKNDVDDYAIFADYSAGNMAGGALVVFRSDDQVDNNDGTDATAYVTTKAGNVGLKGELSLKTGDNAYLNNGSYSGIGGTGDEDTQWGGFVSADMGMDAITVGGLLAFTANGYVADKHFKPTVLIGTDNITAMENFGARGDSFLAVLSAKYKAMPELGVFGNVAYASYTTYPDNNTDSSSVEIDAGLRYQISKGVTYDVNLGYLIPTDYPPLTDDNVLAVSNQFTVNFN